MVMPNIGAFIAWGLITALFIETGWLPNEKFASMVGPMSSTLLIAFTGGYHVAGHRGGVIGAITTMGLIAGSSVPMFLGAIVGPFSGWIIKKFDKLIVGKVKASEPRSGTWYSDRILPGGKRLGEELSTWRHYHSFSGWYS